MRPSPAPATHGHGPSLARAVRAGAPVRGLGRFAPARRRVSTPTRCCDADRAPVVCHAPLDRRLRRHARASSRREPRPDRHRHAARRSPRLLRLSPSDLAAHRRAGARLGRVHDGGVAVAVDASRFRLDLHRAPALLAPCRRGQAAPERQPPRRVTRDAGDRAPARRLPHRRIRQQRDGRQGPWHGGRLRGLRRAHDVHRGDRRRDRVAAQARPGALLPLSPQSSIPISPTARRRSTRRRSSIRSTRARSACRTRGGPTPAGTTPTAAASSISTMGRSTSWTAWSDASSTRSPRSA